MEGLKQSELKKCSCCGLGVAHDNNMTFLRVRIQQHVLNVDAIKRQNGLEQFLGKAAPLAQYVGSDEPLTKTDLHLSVDALVCFSCAITKTLWKTYEEASK